MTFWSWLGGGKRQIEQPDMVWLANDNRLKGVLKSVTEKSREFRIILVASHFSDRLAELRTLFDTNAVAYRETGRAIRASEIYREFAGGNEAALLLAPAHLLVSDEPPIAKSDPSYRVAVLAVECHPLRLFDERIEQFAAAIPYQVELQRFLALDDVVMQMFAGEWVREILQRLGMKEDEAITSSMVARRLRGAQRKIEERYEALQGLKRGLALERLRGAPLREWKNGSEWLAEHGMEVAK